VDDGGSLVRCRCHDIRHVAARCMAVESGRENCRRCGSTEYKMHECSNEPRCTLCVTFNGVNIRHITGSLACPVIRRSNREIRPDRRPAVIKFGERNRG
jgi:hypothetical protein